MHAQAHMPFDKLLALMLMLLDPAVCVSLHTPPSPPPNPQHQYEQK